MKILTKNKFLKNLIFSFLHDFKSELRVLHDLLIEQNHQNRILFQDLLYLRLLNYFNSNPEQKYKEELEFLKKNGSISLIPHANEEIELKLEIEIGQEKGLPFLRHKNRRLYFPNNFSYEKIIGIYLGYVNELKLLDKNSDNYAPHQYQTEKFSVIKGDVLLDIGAAEGIFTLDVIDIVDKVFIFEPDINWLEPLKATFKDYKDKVEIINKAVSDDDTNNQVRLETFLKGKTIKSLFVKMDIEGDETIVLESSKDFLQTSSIQNIRISCCTYHNQKDAEFLDVYFKEIGFSTEFSKGYMIFVHDMNIGPPYFRKGLIRAQKVSSTSFESSEKIK